MFRLLSAGYGQLRGYNRWRIRNRVRRNETAAPDELARHARALVRSRVMDAVRRFPQYAEKVRSRRGALPAPDEAFSLEELPIWTRRDQHTLFSGLPGPPVPDSFVHATGGSTGEPTRFYVSRESYEWRTAVSDRAYAWAEAEEGRSSFYVWGTAVYPPSRGRQIKMHIHHRLQRRTYFDSFEFDDERKAACCRAINRARPHALVGYAGNLARLARFVDRHPGVLTWRARTAVTAAEGLHPGQRELVEATLADDVFMSYGSREFMLIGMECHEHQGYHMASDNLVVEVVDRAGRPAPHGETGRILITDLHNAANPFIRYEIGDLGAIDDPQEPCPCGLPFPRLARVDGRAQETIRLPDGADATALFMPHLMKEFAWVESYQVCQSDRHGITVRLVTRRAFDGRDTAPIEQALRGRLGTQLGVRFERVEALRTTGSGKTPIVVDR